MPSARSHTASLKPITAALLAALLLPTTPAHARHHHSHPHGTAGQFDYYLLSLSIAPDFCALSPAHAAKAECHTLTAAAFQSTPLTIHGLWPNRIGVSVHQQPHACGGPPLAPLPATLTADLTRTMPGGEDLMRHEWLTHGTCSGLSQAAYFTALDQLAQRANATLGAAMRTHNLLTGPVRVAALVAADPSLGPALVVQCEQPTTGGPPLITELRIVLAKDFTPQPASAVGLQHDDGCQSGQGTILTP